MTTTAIEVETPIQARIANEIVALVEQLHRDATAIRTATDELLGKLEAGYQVQNFVTVKAGRLAETHTKLETILSVARAILTPAQIEAAYTGDAWFVEVGA